MKRVLIAGIGNVLLSDDGVGPYVVRTLAARYSFAEGVEILDLGTPTSELIDYLLGRDVVIIIDSVKMNLQEGTVRIYRKEELFAHDIACSEGPHAPSLIQSIQAAKLIGIAPKQVMLVGISGYFFDIGCNLSEASLRAADAAIQKILGELDRADVAFIEKVQSEAPSTWWMEDNGDR